MKLSLKYLLVAALLALSLVACTSLSGNPAAQAQDVPTPAASGSPRIITVVGIGKVNLVPDIARISVGAEVRASTVTEARGQVEQQMAAILAALTKLGIAEKDIQTSHYSIYYETDYAQPLIREGAAQETQGAYRVSSMLEVIVRDVEQAGAVLDAVVEAGANQVYGVSFTVSDESRWQSSARQAAMTDARARAEEFATLAGVELGQVLSVSEVVGGGIAPYMAAERAYGGGGIAPGELELSTQVQVTFAIQ